MRKLLQSEKLSKIGRLARPWLITVAVLLILRYTGLLQGLTDATGRTMLQAGAMDYTPEADGRVEENFDYNFTLKDLQGKPVDFNQFKGKVVFLNLWATWCGPCRFEMPSIHNLYNSVKQNDKIAFVMLSLDRDEHAGKVASYVQDKGLTFPVYMPSGGLPPQLQTVSSIPTTFVLSPDGKIASKKVGAANYDTEKFQQFLQELAKGGKIK